MQEPIALVSGYTRAQHWEKVHHDIYDLYGPKVGLDGIGLWFTYKRFVQRADPNHLLAQKTWKSHRRIASTVRRGREKLHAIRRKLQDAGLIEAINGRDFVRQRQEAYDRQLLVWFEEGKPRAPVTQVTLADLAALGIQNPARSIFITVNDPMPVLAFCEHFGLSFSPYVEARTDLGVRWGMTFDDDYSGLIIGPNRKMAAAQWIEDNLNVAPGDREHRPLVEEAQIRSLLRCGPDEAETIHVRDRLLQRRARLLATGTLWQPIELPDNGLLPADVMESLRGIGWAGDVAEVEQSFQDDPARVRGWLVYWNNAETRNPAGAFRNALRSGDRAPEEAGVDAGRRRYVEGEYSEYIER